MAEDQVRGNKSRAISFKLDNPQERELYQFSFNLNLSEFVKRCLAQEYRRRQQSAVGEMTVDMSSLGGDR